MSYKNAFQDNHAEFEISSIAYEDDVVDDASTPENIEFVYNAPNISIDTSGRFAVHEIIGGSTVRQKIGENPVEVSINGICREQTARQLDGLRNAKFGVIISNRLVGGELQVQFASVSTSPLEDGGAVAVTDKSGQFLYDFDLSAIEVVVGSIEGEEERTDTDETRPDQNVSTGTSFTQ